MRLNVEFVSIVLFQVETVAQFGVIFLLFALGLEFSTAKVFLSLIFSLHSVVNTKCNLL
jgi:Kef-type K+ transport system membrane component KefB